MLEIIFSYSGLLSDKGHRQQEVLGNLEALAYFCHHINLHYRSQLYLPLFLTGGLCIQAVCSAAGSAISSSCWWSIGIAPHRVQLQ